MVDKPAMGELLREHPALAQEIARIMAERDEQREQLTRDRENGRLSELQIHCFSAFALSLH